MLAVPCNVHPSVLYVCAWLWLWQWSVAADVLNLFRLEQFVASTPLLDPSEGMREFQSGSPTRSER